MSEIEKELPRDERAGDLRDLTGRIEKLEAEVERLRSAGVASVLAELSHRDGHPSDSTR